MIGFGLGVAGGALLAEFFAIQLGFGHGFGFMLAGLGLIVAALGASL